MPQVDIDGIATRYEVAGSGPPLLMYAPGGFNAVVETWSTQSIYAKIKLLDHLPKAFTCILFDRRECGQSGGRVEAVTWAHYVAQGKGLLDHLKIPRAFLFGGCMGCPPVAAFAVAHPRMIAGIVLYWPVGGAKYRMSSHQRFAEHLEFVKSDGLAGVVARVQQEGKPFGADPRSGPWASVIKRDQAFAAAYAAQDASRYLRTCETMGNALFDRDTAPGPAPEELMRCDIPALIVPGHDTAHATSAARYLEECLPRSDYWDVAVAAQTEDDTNARVLEFLQRTAA
ncbi:MAG TPA: alpha/beta hydrolase [Xanthobacteraceae bacterium]|jgi:pimeloyl-ACP methyl ester carboxylesterase|nr:alpha/beta hydrolase [Xanthobacteraceae bacterium]